MSENKWVLPTPAEVVARGYPWPDHLDRDAQIVSAWAGFGSELGEVLDVVRKAQIRQKEFNDIRAKLVDELADVYWQYQNLAYLDRVDRLNLVVSLNLPVAAAFISGSRSYTSLLENVVSFSKEPGSWNFSRLIRKCGITFQELDEANKIKLEQRNHKMKD